MSLKPVSVKTESVQDLGSYKKITAPDIKKVDFDALIPVYATIFSRSCTIEDKVISEKYSKRFWEFMNNIIELQGEYGKLSQTDSEKLQSVLQKLLLAMAQDATNQIRPLMGTAMLMIEK